MGRSAMTDILAGLGSSVLCYAVLFYLRWR